MLILQIFSHSWYGTDFGCTRVNFGIVFLPMFATMDPHAIIIC